MACMLASASACLFACHDLSITHDVHAKHVQALGAEGLCQESLSGALNGRAGNALNLHVRAIEGSRPAGGSSTPGAFRGQGALPKSHIGTQTWYSQVRLG